jgi:hypothetical protein
MPRLQERVHARRLHVDKSSNPSHYLARTGVGFLAMTLKKSEDDRQDIDSVRTLALFSYPLVFAVAAGLLVLAEFSAAFRDMFSIHGPTGAVVFTIARLALAFAVVVLVIQWIGNTWHELGMWSKYMDIAFVSRSSGTGIVGLAVALGLLLILTFDIVVFSGYFSVFLLVNYWTQWVSNDYFARALAKTRIDAAANGSVLDALEEYWLRRPQLPRLVSMLFISCVALNFGIIGRMKGANTGRTLEAFAYVIQAANIGVGETLITIWRSTRDRRIRDVVDSNRPPG